ncbi:MAG TPA: SDR family oxidoreductase [Thermoanaerobaculia bacterium]
MTSARPIALVTGASSGIGLEFATAAAADGHDLVLVARRADRLETVAKGLEQEYGIRATVLAADLADPETPGWLVTELERRSLTIDVLVNNAGFGLLDLFRDTPLERELEMIRLNVATIVELTKRLLPGMLARKRGRIANVASTAGFVPGPWMAVYYATKAFLISFSQAIAEELKDTGVTVTVVCPGATLSEFQQVAGIKKALYLRGPFKSDARTVARVGWNATMRGRRVVVVGFFNQLFVQLIRFLPKRLIALFVGMGQSGRR